ncbi:uncharacterized protein METZ01_LOCUS114639 [marine metagenome]|uniref:Uncharacterized protein n=1 Tax=marine metagenome TaxID=408172 RepID=A0A381XAJ4_9ZZZZ
MSLVSERDVGIWSGPFERKNGRYCKYTVCWRVASRTYSYL